MKSPEMFDDKSVLTPGKGEITQQPVRSRGRFDQMTISSMMKKNTKKAESRKSDNSPEMMFSPLRLPTNTEKKLQANQGSIKPYNNSMKSRKKMMPEEA